MSQLHDLTVAELAGQLKAKKVSAQEVARHFLARGKQHAGLGAWLAGAVGRETVRRLSSFR